MGRVKTLNGIPNDIVQKYLSTTMYYDKGYMADWLWKKMNELKIEQAEIAMGAPLGGNCEWVHKDGENIKLNGWFGGPAIWNADGTKIAIPTWIRNMVKGTAQQISVLDIEKREIIRFKKTFSVLDLRTFDKNEILGYDSPI